MNIPLNMNFFCAQTARLTCVLMLSNLLLSTTAHAATNTLGMSSPVNNSTFIAPANIPLTATNTGIIPQVDFRETTLGSLGVVTALPYSLIWSNVSAGSYSVKAVCSSLSLTSSPISISVLSSPPIAQTNTIANSGWFFLQTGLMTQVVTVTNPSPIEISAVRLGISGLQSGIYVWNASGTNAGTPYVQHDYPIPPFQTAELFIEYYVSDRVTIPTPTYSASLVTPQIPTAPSGTIKSTIKSPPDLMIDYSYMIQFRATNTKRYYIQYSPDRNTWFTAWPSVVATSTSAYQWIDEGPPKTKSHPKFESLRFYRVVETP